MALEELPGLAYGVSQDGNISVHLFGPGKASFTLAHAGTVALEQVTAYPFDGAIRIRVACEREARFTIFVRIPAWASKAAIEVNGVAFPCVAAPGSYAAIERRWRSGDEFLLNLPMPPVAHRKGHRNIQESRAPDGSPVHQQVMCYEYLGLTRGPLVYATDLIDGFKTDETIRLGANGEWLEVMGSPNDEGGPTIRMTLGYRPPILFWPYYRAGGRGDGTWRLTWMSVAQDLHAHPE